jgi:predicted small secreted protein
MHEVLINQRRTGMKRLLILAMVLAMVMSCSTVSKVGQDVGVVAQKVCNFDVSMSQEAQAAMAFISVAAGIVGPIYGVPVTAGQALAILNTVSNASQTGACVLLSDLQNALDYFNALSTQYKEVQKTQKGVRAVAIPSLINLNAKLSAEKHMGK